MPKGIPNKRYTPEFKQLVVETMREEHLSVREAMRRFEINNHGIIERWERLYLITTSKKYAQKLGQLNLIS